MRRLPDISDARAAWWACRALRTARTRLRDGEMRGVRLPEPSPLPPSASRAVRLVLRAARASCLERALVLQRWLAAQGVARDVVVGTEGGARARFAAHAWVDGEPQPPGRRFVEITRLSP